jgi:F0F1-type ATP synthase membrane subunit b/b'
MSTRRDDEVREAERRMERRGEQMEERGEQVEERIAEARRRAEHPVHEPDADAHAEPGDET